MNARAAIAALALAAAAATTASAPIADASAPAQPQHIVLIVADDLGWNDVGFHAGASGRTQVPTPNLDKLAARGVRLGSYFVQPTCSPTRSSIMTGRHVTHMGIYQPNLGPDNTRGVPFELPFLPEQLRALGFATHAVGKWHLGTFDRRLVPTGRGFDSFLGYYGGAEDYFSHEAINASDFHFDEGLELRPFMQAAGRYSTHLYAERAVKVIEDFARAKERRDAAATASQRRLRGVGASGGNDRLFLYLSWQAIHAPDQVPPEYEERFSKTISDKHRRTVAGMIACMDDAIGNVTAALDAEGMLDDTLVVFTTDNGGPAANFNKNMASNWPLRGMKGGVRGTGFVSGAGLQKRGYTHEGLLHASDWYHTLLSAAAGPTENYAPPLGEGDPPFEPGDGVDAWHMLSTGSSSPRAEVLIEAHPPGEDEGVGQAILARVDDHSLLKLVLEKGSQAIVPTAEEPATGDGWYESGSDPSLYSHLVQCEQPPPVNAPDFCNATRLPCLFNLTADPCEYHDLSARLPHELATLMQRLAWYGARAVPSTTAVLPMCKDPIGDPTKPLNGSWMPVCL